MPELPEVETMARDLHRMIAGATITGVRVPRPNVLREASARTLRRRVTGARITRCWRRAKIALIELSTGDRIAIQPRFTGRFLIGTPDTESRERSYTTVEFALDDGRSLIYSDVRRLGTVTLMDARRFARQSAALGAEPLEPAFTPAALHAVLRKSKQAVKKAIMDQRKLAGVGNIYANEALWRAGIDPSRAATSVSADECIALHRAITGVLREAIDSRGTSFRDYRDASGNRGEFVENLAVYGRAGEPCTRCGARLVGTHTIDGRSTVLCVHCQH